eukprot:1739286-Amphidinium_carterae.1
MRQTVRTRITDGWENKSLARQQSQHARYLVRDTIVPLLSHYDEICIANKLLALSSTLATAALVIPTSASITAISSIISHVPRAQYTQNTLQAIQRCPNAFAERDSEAVGCELHFIFLLTL